MSALAVSLVAFAVVMGGAVLGALLRAVLPKHHVTDESKDVIKVGIGLIATLAALVLGLLIASAKSSFDTKSAEVKDSAANEIIGCIKAVAAGQSFISPVLSGYLLNRHAAGTQPPSTLDTLTQAERRVEECAKLGFATVLGPAGTPPPAKLALAEAETVREAVRIGLEAPQPEGE